VRRRKRTHLGLYAFFLTRTFTHCDRKRKEQRKEEKEKKKGGKKRGTLTRRRRYSFYLISPSSASTRKNRGVWGDKRGKRGKGGGIGARISGRTLFHRARFGSHREGGAGKGGGGGEREGLVSTVSFLKHSRELGKRRFKGGLGRKGKKKGKGI